MAIRNFCAFIKVGEQIFMEKLLREGQVFCKPLQYFNREEQESLRHDKYDGAAYLTQVKNIKIYLPQGKVLLGTANSGQLYYDHPEDQGNVFCLYAIETSSLDLTSELTKAFNLDMNGLNFGDSAVLIFDPGEFIERLKKEVESQGFSFQYSPVLYYEETEYQGELSPFYKSKKFELQKEFRFWIPNKLGSDLIFKIGDISDIATLLSKTDLANLSYSPM